MRLWRKIKLNGTKKAISKSKIIKKSPIKKNLISNLERASS